jgi:ABC-type nitrate/sulfonate/bicarbonate transport system substrate-binding protein
MTRLNPVIAVFMFLALSLGSSQAGAQPRMKMTIGTGVDPSLAQFYVAKEAGIFERNGLDVQLNLGPSGSAMIAFLIGDQLQAALGAEQAGIQAHNLDPTVVIAGESVSLPHFFGLVGRRIDSIEGLKGKKIGVDSGSSSQTFWLALVQTLGLNPKDYTIVQIEPPEMIAALERGDIDAFSAWEPWVTRALDGIPDTRNLHDNAGIIVPRDYVWLNRQWTERNKPAAVAFMRSMVEATDYIRAHKHEAAGQIAHLLKLDPALTETLMGKVEYSMRLDNDSLAHMREIEAQLKQTGKLTKPVDWSGMFVPDLLREVAPAVVSLDAPK